MNKKAQFGGEIFAFALILIAIIITSYFCLYLVNKVTTPVAEQLGKQSPGAEVAVNTVRTGFMGIWDSIMALVFIFNIILLLLTSFFINAHPAFVILYIFSLVIIFILLPYVQDLAIAVYENNEFTSGIDTYMPITKFIMNNLVIMVLVIAVISGIIIYGKLKGGSGGEFG